LVGGVVESERKWVKIRWDRIREFVPEGVGEDEVESYLVGVLGGK
jgi:hypothetical protein